MHQISREDAVALCEGYGLLMASGWNRDRLTAKTAEMQRLIRAEEYVGFEGLDERLQKIGLSLAKAEDFEVVQKVKPAAEEEPDDVPADGGEEERIEEDEDEEDEGNDEEDENEVVECVLKVGQGVVVNEEKVWKGTVTKILNDRYVEVEDRKGEVWDVAIGKCEPLPEKKGKKSADPQEEELRRLQEQVRKAKQKKKGKKQKREGMTRLDSVFLALEQIGVPFSKAELAKKANEVFVAAGGEDKANGAGNYIYVTLRALKHFGLVSQEKGKYTLV